MNALHLTLLTAASAFLLPAPATAGSLQPLQFFDGRTEGNGTIKTLLRKPFKTRSVGRGRIEPDGSLSLVQQIADDGKPPRERRWRIRQTGPRSFAGTMSEASGPVTIDDVGGRYRFRFRMKGNLSVEQWLSPLPGNLSVRSTLTIRKLGVTVGTSDGTIRKVADH